MLTTGSRIGKAYTFVNNKRHRKSARIIRACENCRKRKIKCGGGKVGKWPCSKCERLKQDCIPPKSFENFMSFRPYSPESTGTPDQRQVTNHDTTLSLVCDTTQTQQSFFDGNAPYHDTQPDSSRLHLHVKNGPFVLQKHKIDHSLHEESQSLFLKHQLPSPSTTEQQPLIYTDGHGIYQQYNSTNIQRKFKIARTDEATYFGNKAYSWQEEQTDVTNVRDTTGVPHPTISAPGHNICIPPEMMPNDETALIYFDFYFAHIHPYVPVLCRVTFYQEWQENREIISPLILEAIFAIGEQLSGTSTKGRQWLDLASQQVNLFTDPPRLSTLQALLILVRAREIALESGYYDRPLITIAQCVEIGQGLNLHHHCMDHRSGIPCDFTTAECQLRHRTWQVISVCKAMVGIAQGRRNHQIKINTGGIRVPRSALGSEQSEYLISRNFNYFTWITRTVSQMSSVYARLCERKDWSVDPEFQLLGKSLETWFAGLPLDMRIDSMLDGSSPFIPSHFVGNMHACYHLTRILFSRLMMNSFDRNNPDGQWNHHMMDCYHSAKVLCCLQETILDTFGFPGLCCMQKGYWFSSYAGLCCIDTYLIGIESPDLPFLSDVNEYCTRHIRVLERVLRFWPTSELEQRITSSRITFSEKIK